MTTSQYLIAWTVYGAAAVGCLIVWWRMTRPLNATFASWLRMYAAVILLTPGYTMPNDAWLSPAFLAIIYDALSTTIPQSLPPNAVLLIITAVAATVIKALFFRKPLGRRGQPKAVQQPQQPQQKVRREPQVVH